MTRKRVGVSTRDVDFVPMNMTVTHNTRNFLRSRHTAVAVRRTKRPRQTVQHHIIEEQPSSRDTSEPTHVDPGDGAGGSDWQDAYVGDSDEPASKRQRGLTRVPKKKKKRRVDLLREWMGIRNVFLDEIIRLEGLRGHPEPPLCCICQSATGLVRCEDCIEQQLMCEECICQVHSHEPLHRVSKWTGTFFAKFSLAAAGLAIQLGHDGRPCATPRQHTNKITVIDITGIQSVAVRYCDCANVGTERTYVQLLRAGWWPATSTRPRTVTTLRTLKTFHAMTIQGKMNAYDFWNGLVRVSDGTGLFQPKNQYKDFIRTIRCFRNIRALKRAGRAHDPAGIDATLFGELCVECPACPHPGRNLPEKWEDAPEEDQWKYASMFSMDANFKLKLKNRGLDDVELAPGWAYFVPKKPYQEHIDKHKDEVEMKACGSTFAAVDLANIPAQKRFSVNGVGAVICARHLFYLMNSVADLHKGKRYCSMDYILLSAIAQTAADMKKMVLTYDIACQFSKNFHRRMAQFPVEFQIDVSQTDITFLIPKFHLLAHGTPCQVSYSLNFTEGVGRTCGEGIEAGWADTNGASLSTREMSGEGRHEALDDFFGAINWRKTVGLGNQLHRALKQAVPAYERKKAVFEESTATFPPAVLHKWEAMLAAWHADPKKPNPYREPECITTIADVKLELAQQEADEVNRGVVSLHETSASVFLSVGLDLEDQQRALRTKAAGEEAKTKIGKAALQDKRNALQHRIKAWRSIQAIYMPVASVLMAREANALGPEEIVRDARSNIEDEKLWLPSAIPKEMWAAGLTPNIVQKAIRLRRAQAEDALHEIRRHLRIRMGLVHYKRVFVAGPSQRTNTRARQAIKTFNEKLARHVARYRGARAALAVLEPDGDWPDQLRVLRQEDIRAPREDDEGLGKGHREMSWIWRTLRHESRDAPRLDDNVSEEEVHEGLRVDWVKSRARARRWNEEIILLKEEMPRSVSFLQWKSTWWSDRAERRTDVRADVLSGLRAYAARQAAVYSSLAASFRKQWTKSLANHQMSVEWPEPLPEVSLLAVSSISVPSAATAPGDSGAVHELHGASETLPGLGHDVMSCSVDLDVETSAVNNGMSALEVSDSEEDEPDEAVFGEDDSDNEVDD
ncbi:hypothetical protein BV25DRAFT_1912397 [Artomyces pyxidatus]|uniref:Uncharacterized protein n=1 Tax=Artomyces pyxidatus TaxID=48021 RepID=A0ACB8TF70_9AGAM|nr:hypothetical protein BV25DRAFT_1912397 [Artomyces pyxidatus]